MQSKKSMDKIKFDGFVRKNIKEDGLEQPSLNFTTAILSKIEEEKEIREVLTYTPLISKKVWVALGAILVGVIGILIYGNVDEKYNWWPEKALVKFGELKLLEKIPEFTVSNIYNYAFVGMAFFVCLQIVVLKNHFAKRLL